MPSEADQSHGAPQAPPAAPEYSPGDKGGHPQGGTATRWPRSALGVEVVALYGEVYSTYANEFARAYPGRFFEMFIAEQQMVAAVVGLSARHYIPFAFMFAAFFTRAYDFIRMAAISQASIRPACLHAGVEIGADWLSQMALEDLAMCAVHLRQRSCTRADATSTAAPSR